MYLWVLASICAHITQMYVCDLVSMRVSSPPSYSDLGIPWPALLLSHIHTYAARMS